jgi:hypothetical protein
MLSKIFISIASFRPASLVSFASQIRPADGLNEPARRRRESNPRHPTPPYIYFEKRRSPSLRQNKVASKQDKVAIAFLYY